MKLVWGIVLEEEECVPVYVRRNRGPYSGLMLQSIYRILRGVVIIIVVVGFLLMFDPLV